MSKFLVPAALAAGLIVLGWVGAGYLTSQPLALAVTLLIAACYGAGMLELRRYQQATSTLMQALDTIPAGLTQLGDWLAQLHPSLRNTVRLRVEGERSALPGPALTPYLVGLLVLLGMLGTFLGMVLTLKGTVTALENTTDLQAIRNSLAAPVRGLGVAFGTSIAGVAASALLGLVSALCRRERLQAAQLLDSAIATTLRPHSLAQQRQDTAQALQLQARLMPELAQGLQTLMAQLQQQNQQLNEQLLARQDRFHQQTSAAYTQLASAVDQTLRTSLLESARAAGAAIQPVVENTMAGIAQVTRELHERVAQSTERHLDGVSQRFGQTVAQVSSTWTEALAQQTRSNSALSQHLDQALQQFNQRFEQGSSALLDGVAQQQATASADLLATVQTLSRDTAALQSHTVQTVAQHMDEAQARLQATLSERDTQRLAAWTGALEQMAVNLQTRWQQAGEQTLGQQQQICRTLEQTARDMGAQSESQARATLGEIARLMQAAAEAPRAAAEVIGQLRQQLSDSMAHDNTLLDERRRLMETLATLLDAVNHASGEQRSAIQALVSTSAELLDQVGSRFNQQVQAQSAQLTDATAQLAGSAVDVASLGEAFGHGVTLFSASSDKLTAQLQRIEAALSGSMARSDEQLAYYVAQAREVIDLSLASQKQVIDDLQRLAQPQARQAAPAAAAAAAEVAA